MKHAFLDRACRCKIPLFAMMMMLLAAAAYPVRYADAATPSGRITLSLDGTWEVEESMSADRTPSSFRHTVPVPGLVHSSSPAFPDVDQYTTTQVLSSLVYYERYSPADYQKLAGKRGVAHQQRNYFWYHKEFAAPSRHAVAILSVNKAQFGTVVYLNGQRIGEHQSCFTAGYFDLTHAIRWKGSNRLVIRVGAHPGVLPETVTCGTDFEKSRWTPGLYDSVNIILTDNPVIATVQVAPRLATADNVASVLVQTELRNYSTGALDTELHQRVFEWKSGTAAAVEQSQSVHLAAHESKLVTQVLPVPAAHLWSPEDPFLYKVESRSSGDSTVTRFGMREFHFDTATQRGYLNGKLYFLRGTNIGLHRFFEDPLSGTLPWNEAWTQRLLRDIPKQMHWNAMRFTIGPVPNRWLDIADESGLLIEYEYPVWVGSPVYTAWKSHYNTQQMISEYTEWMRDNWNHPSIFLWDATNESTLPDFASQVIPAVRALDLSNRAWENSYNAPGDANDPVEDHHYFTEALGGKFDAGQGGKPFDFADLEWMDGPVSNPFTKSAHAKILNEYGWMWLNRDGSPTILTQQLYPKLLGDHDTVENRRALAARELSAETELWRAYRRYVGVMHFVYLSSSGPDAFTSDNFVDLQKLTLEPKFEAAMEQAFRPLGVYLNFWHAAIDARADREYVVHMVNDEDRPRVGRLELSYLDAGGRKVDSRDTSFSLSAFGAQSYVFEMPAPAQAGPYLLQAAAIPEDDAGNPTTSKREVEVKAVSAEKAAH